MSIPQPATDDVWQQTLDRLGMRVHWLGTTDRWAPRHQRTDQRHGEAARDALRALNAMGTKQPYPFIHSWGLRPGRRVTDVILGLMQFEGWRVTGCTIESPGTDQETYVFSLGRFSPPLAHGVVLVSHLEERLVFPPERADYERRRLPLLGVEFFEYVQLDLPKPAASDSQGNGRNRSPDKAKAARRTR